MLSALRSLTAAEIANMRHLRNIWSPAILEFFNTIGRSLFQTGQAVSAQPWKPVIPPRRHRRYQHHYDRIAYRQRSGIEGFFAKLKQWRRIATCYNKLAKTFMALVKIASIMLWIK